jgi:hypothetical protein
MKTNSKKLLLQKAQSYVRYYFDEYAMIQLLEWKRVGERSVELGLGRPEERALPYIEAIEHWKNQVMADYLLIRKPNLAAGVYVDFSNHQEPPYTFTELFLIINEDMRPAGWEVPILPE